MPSLLTTAIIFVSLSAGSMLGMWLRKALPPHHRDTESRDLVKLGMGFVGTMTALLLGLLVASTKGSYDAQKGEVTDIAARVVVLDRILAHYGPEAAAPRELLRASASRMLNQMWPGENAKAPTLEPSATGADALYESIEALNPATDAQRNLKSHAVSTAVELGTMRWHLFEQSSSSVSTPMLVVVVSWLTFIFVCFGYLAPLNATVIATLLICALTVTSSLFLILEMDRPFGGIIHIRSDAMKSALAHLGEDIAHPAAPGEQPAHNPR